MEAFDTATGVATVPATVGLGEKIRPCSRATRANVADKLIVG